MLPSFLTDVSKMDFLYTNGVLSALQDKFLDKAKYTKLIKTDRKDFTQTLIGMGYGAGLTEGSLEDLINAELLALKGFLQSLSPEPKYTDLFYMTYDAMNLKMLYKQAKFDVGTNAVLSPMGAIDAVALEQAILHQETAGLSKDQITLLQSIETALADVDDPRLLSAIIDDRIYAFVFRNLSFRLGKAMNTYFQGSADIANVITMVRSQILHWDKAEFMAMLLHGGLIPFAVFEEAYGLDGNAMAKVFQSFYNERMTRILKKYWENQSLDQLERSLDAYLLEITREFQYDSFQIGPILVFFLRKLAEAKNIRLIYADEKVGLSDLLEA